MEAGEFLAGLKASGSADDIVQFDGALAEYARLRAELSASEASILAVNLLCMLCRNLEKAPGWCERADAGSLLRACVAAARDVRRSDVAQRTRALAAMFHLHRYASKQANVKPELVFQLSSFIFKEDEEYLLPEYCKTYWVILVDKLVYVEKLKTTKIQQFIPTFVNDIAKVIHVHDTAAFCTDNLNSLIKKLYHIFSSQAPRDLNGLFEAIFVSLLRKKDLNAKLKDAKVVDLYRKICECFNVIVENASQYGFKTCALKTAVRFATTLFGRQNDIVHCLEVFYLKSYCKILTGKTDVSLKNALNELLRSIDTMEKCETTAKETYPYVNPILRAHIDSCVRNYDKNDWTTVFTSDTQNLYLKLITKLMKRLAHSPQILKCNDCSLKSGLHDALRLSFSMRNFITVSLKHEMNITEILPQIIESYELQRQVIEELRGRRCANGDKCRMKAQTDVHNNSILLYKSRNYEHSIRLFDMYIRGELSMYANPDYSERTCLSRAFYNKAICELDSSKYEKALRSAFLSLALTDKNGLEGNKNMSLVIDIKSKALQSRKVDDIGENGKDTEDDELQTMTILEACRISYELKEYGDLKPLLCTLEFSALLCHEMSRYCKLWPSLLPIVGVWSSLHGLLDTTPRWALVECRESVLWSLCEAALSTARCARTFHHARLAAIVPDLLGRLRHTTSVQFRVASATLLFLQADLDLADAKEKHGWRAAGKAVLETSKDCERLQPCPTLPQEHLALERAFQAVDAWTLLLPEILNAGAGAGHREALHDALRVASAYVATLQLYERGAHAAQLAHVCVQLSSLLSDAVLHVVNAGALLGAALRRSAQLDALASDAAASLDALLREAGASEQALVYMCQAATYHWRCGRQSLAASLVRYVQLAVLTAEKTTPGSVDVACGRLLETQALLSDARRGAPTMLTALNAVHRHHIMLKSKGVAWWERRLHGATLSAQAARAGARSARGAARVLLVRRASAAAATTLRGACATLAAGAHATVAWANLTASDLQVKIDTIKSILEEPVPTATPEDRSDEITSIVERMQEVKIQPTHKADNIEAVLDVTVFKKTQSGPASPYFHVNAFTMPDFLSHIDNCQCYACHNPLYAVIALELAGIEAAVQFRKQEAEIARNYFNGVLKMFSSVDAKIDRVFQSFMKRAYNDYVVEVAKDNVVEELLRVKVRIFTEYSFFLLDQGKYDTAEKCVGNIFDMFKSFKVKDVYLEHDALNLVCAIENLKNKDSKTVAFADDEIEKEIDSLKLSPISNASLPIAKTPQIKMVPPKVVKPKIIINEDELPHVNRKVIKLNLDDNSPTEDIVNSEPTKPKKFFKSKDTEFKIPVPKTTLPVPEIITPLRTTRNSKLPVKAKNRLLKTELSDCNNGVQKSDNILTTKIFKKSAVATSKSKAKLKSSDSSDSEVSKTDNSQKEESKVNAIAGTTSQSPDMFEDEAFYTPMSKPVEQFFTPMSTIKTYCKKSLRHQIVKNLETEFQTPKTILKPAKILSPTETPHIPEISRRSQRTNDTNVKVGTNTDKHVNHNLTDSKIYADSSKANVLNDKIVADDTNHKVSNDKRDLDIIIPKVSNDNTDSDDSKPKKSNRKTVKGVSKRKATDCDTITDAIDIKSKGFNDRAGADDAASTMADDKNVTDDTKHSKTDTASKLKVADRKKLLKRATSPGKLNVEDMETRRSRPVRASRIQQFRSEKLKLSPDETAQSSIGLGKKK